MYVRLRACVAKTTVKGPIPHSYYLRQIDQLVDTRLSGFQLSLDSNHTIALVLLYWPLWLVDEAHYTLLNQ